MIDKTNLYSDFALLKIQRKKNKTQNNSQNTVKKVDPRPILGAAIGVGVSMLISHNIFKNKTGTFKDVAEMLIMAGGGNIGGVIGGSIDKTDIQKKKKIKEAGFQMMNTSIPMIMVSSVLAICKSLKFLNKVPVKIIASFAAMTSGAMVATKITNIGKEENKKRKYSPKDAVANFDDIIATISIGFKGLLEYIPVSKLLPFIYAYCGARSGLVGENKKEEKVDLQG